MAELKEFAGYRYNTDICGSLSDVTAMPYDLMNDKEREEYYKKSEYNIARVSNGEKLANDNEENNQYKRAGKFLEDCIKKGVLLHEDKPVMYLYEQHSIYKNTVYVNHGIVALLKLEDLEENSMIKVCEETSDNFMEDRFKLLEQTEANIDMISCMYMDYERPLAHLLNEIAEEKPVLEFDLKEKITDELTTNKLWVIDDKARIDFIKNDLKKAKIFITDGHNRYHAALKYMKECKAKNPNHTGNEPYNYIMAFLNNAYGDSLVQLPVHRILSAKKKFSEDFFIACAQDHFKVEKIIIDTSNDDLVETMKKQVETSRRENRIGVYCGGDYFYRLTLKDREYVKSVLPEHSDEFCMLDTTVLNVLLLNELLDITKDNYNDFISTTRRATKGVKWVNSKEAACMFVMNSVKAERICEVVNSGEKMPAKSICLFPKAVTGVVINKL